MQPQYSQGTAPSHHPPPYPPPEVSGNGGSVTSSLRQWRKKDYVEKKSSEENSPSANENPSHIARVAPHSYYPRPPDDQCNYQHQYGDYSLSYKPTGPVKYSEIVENQQAQTIEHITPVIQKHKEKEYVELCSGPPQSHLKQFPDHISMKQSTYPEPPLSHQYIPKESHIHPFLQKQSQMPQYMQKEPYQQFLSKYNMQSQYPQPYPSEPNNFLAHLNKINPRMAQSIINDTHLRETQIPVYHSLDHNRPYPQSQRMYHHPPPNPAHSQRNLPPSYNYPQSYNYNVKSNIPPVDPYNRPYQHNIPKYLPEQPLPNIYNESMHMNYGPYSSKLSPNYSQLEYAQHYQHRRQLQQEYYGHPPFKEAFAQNSPEDLGSDPGSCKPSLKQYLESWVEENISGNLPEMIADMENIQQLKTALQSKSADGQEQPLYVLDTTEITNDSLPQFLHLQQFEKLPENIRGYYHSAASIPPEARQVIVENRSVETFSVGEKTCQPKPPMDGNCNVVETEKSLENKVVEIHILEDSEAGDVVVNTQMDGNNVNSVIKMCSGAQEEDSNHSRDSYKSMPEIDKEQDVVVEASPQPVNLAISNEVVSDEAVPESKLPEEQGTVELVNADNATELPVNEEEGDSALAPTVIQEFENRENAADLDKLLEEIVFDGNTTQKNEVDVANKATVPEIIATEETTELRRKRDRKKDHKDRIRKKKKGEPRPEVETQSTKLEEPQLSCQVEQDRVSNEINEGCPTEVSEPQIAEELPEDKVMEGLPDVHRLDKESDGEVKCSTEVQSEVDCLDTRMHSDEPEVCAKDTELSMEVECQPTDNAECLPELECNDIESPKDVCQDPRLQKEMGYVPKLPELSDKVECQKEDTKIECLSVITHGNAEVPNFRLQTEVDCEPEVCSGDDEPCQLEDSGSDPKMECMPEQAKDHKETDRIIKRADPRLQKKEVDTELSNVQNSKTESLPTLNTGDAQVHVDEVRCEDPPDTEMDCASEVPETNCLPEVLSLDLEAKEVECLTDVCNSPGPAGTEMVEENSDEMPVLEKATFDENDANIVYHINDSNVVLQIADELLEINITVQNGKKVILVKTFSDAVIMNSTDDNCPILEDQTVVQQKNPPPPIEHPVLDNYANVTVDNVEMYVKEICEGPDITVENEVCVFNEEVVSSSTEAGSAPKDVPDEPPPPPKQEDKKIERKKIPKKKTVTWSDQTVEEPKRCLDKIPKPPKTKAALKLIEPHHMKIKDHCVPSKPKSSIASKIAKLKKPKLDGHLKHQKVEKAKKDEPKNIPRPKERLPKRTDPRKSKVFTKTPVNIDSLYKMSIEPENLAKMKMAMERTKVEVPKEKEIEPEQSLPLVSVQENSITSSTCQDPEATQRERANKLIQQINDDWEDEDDGNKIMEGNTRRLSLQEYNDRKRVTEPDPDPDLTSNLLNVRRRPLSPKSPELSVNFISKTYSRTSSFENDPKNEESLSSGIELQLPKRNRTLPTPNYNQEYLKKALMNDLQTVNQITTTLIKENQELMRRFLEQQRLTATELKKVKQIIRYKRLVQHLTTMKVRESEPNNNEPMSPAHECAGLKRSVLEKRRKKRFRFLYSDGEYEEDSAIMVNDACLKRARLDTLVPYSVHQSNSQGQLTLVFKRNVKSDPRMQPFVKLERIASLDRLALNL